MHPCEIYNLVCFTLESVDQIGVTQALSSMTQG